MYFHLLHSFKPIRPDPAGVRAYYYRPRTLFDAGCALIQTCKLIAAEATLVLYRSNIFEFTDEACLFPCIGTDPEAKSSYDIMGMYIFLRLIGPDNRANIRHLIIELCYPDLFVTESEEYEEANVPCGRQYLKALELLSRKHGLEIFEIITRPFSNDLMVDIFWDKDVKGIQMMSTIKGLKEFRCWEPMKGSRGQLVRRPSEKMFRDLARETIVWLKKNMTAPKIEARKQPPSDSTATVHTPTWPSKLTERLALLEQERKELADIVRDAVTRMERAEKELDEVRRAVGEITETI